MRIAVHSRFRLSFAALLMASSGGSFAPAPSAHALPESAVVHVAVASNFAKTMEELAAGFRTETGFALRVSAASSGKLYAQIKSGAPFDVFFSADDERPDLLVEEALGDPLSLRIYAIGRLVMVTHVGAEERPRSPETGAELDSCIRTLDSDRLQHLAIANPNTAPYGRAALQTLEGLDSWDRLRPKLVRGENVSQAFQFVESGNAQAGFVSRSQRQAYTGANLSDCEWNVPADRHEPIIQKMVVLERATQKPAVEAFEKYMAGDLAARIIAEHGYETAPVDRAEDQERGRSWATSQD